MGSDDVENAKDPSTFFAVEPRLLLYTQKRNQGCLLDPVRHITSADEDVDHLPVR